MNDDEPVSSDSQTDGAPEEIDDETSGPVKADADDSDGGAPETVNLVGDIDEKEQKRICDAVISETDGDWRDSEKMRTKRSQIVQLYLGDLPPKEEGYAQIHYAIIAKAINRTQPRIYDQQFPSNGEFFGVRPTSSADLPRCVRVAKHLNWQILHKIPEYVPNHDAGIVQWLLYGSMFTFMYWNPALNRPCHEVCSTDDIILPYAYPKEALDPSMSRLPRITRVLRKYRYGIDGIDALVDSGYYDKTNVSVMFAGEKSDSAGSDDTEDYTSKVREVIDKAAGSEKPETEKPARRILLEQHRWWKLPEWDRWRPVIATVDRRSRTLIGFVLREDEDPEDRARYNREKAANDAQFSANMAQYNRDMQLYLAGKAGLIPTAGQPGMTAPPIPGAPAMTPPPAPNGPPVATPPPQPGVPSMTPPPVPGSSLPVAPATPPVQPTPPELPEQPKMVPINFFTHFVCIPNPEGVYGLGVGMLLEGNNMVADAIASAMVDAGKLSNGMTGFTSREFKTTTGELRYKPGELIRTDCLPGELDQSIKVVQFKGPEPQLAEFIRDQKQEAEDVSGANEILSGEVGGSNETATTTQIRSSNAMAQISVLSERYGRARTEEGRKLARLNSVYLGDDEYFAVIDPYHSGPPKPDEKISRADYLEDVAITITADRRMASQPQRFQEATQAIQSFAQIAQFVPALQQNVALWNALGKQVAMSMDRPDIVAAMNAQPMPPPPPPPPPGALPPHTAPAPSRTLPPHPPMPSRARPPLPGAPPPGGAPPLPPGVS